MSISSVKTSMCPLRFLYNLFIADKMYMKPMRLIKNSIMNPNYYPTYASYGVAGFIMAIYFCEWKQVGQYIPLWNKRYTAD